MPTRYQRLALFGSVLNDNFRPDSDVDSLVSFGQVQDLSHHHGISTRGSPPLALQYARNYRFLRRKGLTIRKLIDSLIATYCLENDHELLHNDSDFDGYEQHLGRQVVHP